MNNTTMKNNHILKAIFAFLIFLGLASCDNRELIQVDNTAAPITMNLSAEHIFLDQNYPDNPALNITWSQAGYTVPVEMNYRIEASATQDFANPYTLGTVAQSVRTATYTVSQMNTAAQTIGLIQDVEGKMYLRVTSYLGSNALSSVSNVTSVMITPYALTYPSFYLVGAASAVGWNSGSAQLLYKKDSKSMIYTYMTPESFRFLGQQAWSPLNYSLDVPATDQPNRYFKQTTPNIVFGDHENMKFTDTEGIYLLEIDADGTKKSLSATKSALGYNYDNLYMVGSINGWDAANPITMTKTGEGTFEVTTTLGADAEFKFIGQKAWAALEWGNILKDNPGNSGYVGPKDANSNIVFHGNGGSYKVTVNLKMGTFTIQ